MIEDEIKSFVQREVRMQLPQQLESNPPPTCRKCRQRIVALERQMKDFAAQLAEAGRASGESTPRKRSPRANGKTLKKLRERYGITQTDAAILLKTTITSVNRWERGKMEPSSQSKAQISELRNLGKRRIQQMLKERREQAFPEEEPPPENAERTLP